MGVVIGVVVGYVLGCRAGPEGWAEFEEAWKTITTSDEVRDLAGGALAIARDLLEKRTEVIAGVLGLRTTPHACARWHRSSTGAAEGTHPCASSTSTGTRRRPRALVAQITALAGDDDFKFMEVCGGHTHTIYRHGIEHVLPPTSSWCTVPAARCASSRWAGSTTPSPWPTSPASSSPRSAT